MPDLGLTLQTMAFVAVDCKVFMDYLNYTTQHS